MKNLFVKNISVTKAIPKTRLWGPEYRFNYDKVEGVEYEIIACSDVYFSHQELVERIERSCPISKLEEIVRINEEMWDVIEKCPEALREWGKRNLIKEILK